MEELKLIRWYNDNFPPIDLNDNVEHVIDLVREIKRLRKENKDLAEVLNSLN